MKVPNGDRAKNLRKEDLAVTTRADSILIVGIDGNFTVSGVIKRVLVAEYFNEPESSALDSVRSRLGEFAELVTEKYKAGSYESDPGNPYYLRCLIDRQDLEDHFRRGAPGRS